LVEFVGIDAVSRGDFVRDSHVAATNINKDLPVLVKLDFRDLFASVLNRLNRCGEVALSKVKGASAHLLSPRIGEPAQTLSRHV
jgi:hypothetical protein